MRIDAREKNFRTMILANDSSLKEFYVSLAKREKERERRKAQANLPITGRSWDPYARSMIGRVIYGLDVLRKSIFLSLLKENQKERREGVTHVSRVPVIPWIQQEVVKRFRTLSLLCLISLFFRLTIISALE